MATDFSKEAQEWAGEFFIVPNEAALAGVLRHDPIKGSTLRFSRRNKDRSLDSCEYPIISGVIEGYLPVSLLNCFDYGWTRNSYDFETKTIFVNYIVSRWENANFESPDFSGFSISSPSIRKLVGYVGLDDDYPNVDEVIIKWKRPADIIYPVDSNKSICFYSNYKRKIRFDGRVDFETTPHYSIKYNNGTSWTEIITDITSLEIFLCFATRSWLGPPTIELTPSARRHGNRHTSQSDEGYEEPYKVFLSKHWYRDDIKNRKSPIIPFVKDKELILRAFGRWLKKRNVYERVTRLLRAAEEYDAGIETSFLFLAQALEYLHRETIGGSLMDTAAFKEVSDALLASIPLSIGHESREAIIQRIRYMNEISFRKRVRQLLSATNLDPHSYNHRDISNSIANLRNILTHHLEHHSETEEWLHKAGILKSLMVETIEIYICKLLGFSQEELSYMIESDGEISVHSRGFAAPKIPYI